MNARPIAVVGVLAVVTLMIFGTVSLIRGNDSSSDVSETTNEIKVPEPTSDIEVTDVSSSDDSITSGNTSPVVEGNLPETGANEIFASIGVAFLIGGVAVYYSTSRNLSKSQLM